jgi:glucokinase
MIADIGGTNARFALLDGMERRDEVVLACADYPDLVSAAEEYLQRVGARTNGRPLEAAIAIAGPVTGDIIRMTNHVWQFSAARVRHLEGSDIEQVGGGKAQPNAPIAVIGPGTGLGVSGLIPSGEHWIPLQGEGGHSTLSVMNERELAVLQQLQQRFSHVSAERVISGPGLVTLYDAICGVEGVIPEVLTPPEITKRAQEGTCRLCFETVSMFCALLGTMAGNLVLTLGALGGAYIGGGIAPGLGPMFTSSRFRDRFEDKGRFTDYVSRVPTFVIRAELPALLGLASAFTDPGPRLEAQ